MKMNRREVITGLATLPIFGLSSPRKYVYRRGKAPNPRYVVSLQDGKYLTFLNPNYVSP